MVSVMYNKLLGSQPTSLDMALDSSCLYLARPTDTHKHRTNLSNTLNNYWMATCPKRFFTHCFFFSLQVLFSVE